MVQQDEMSSQMCWMCVQQLDNFHKFHEKIHEKQKKLLQEKYDLFCIKLNFSDAHEYEEFETIQVKESNSILDQDSEVELQMNENEENTYYLVEAKDEDNSKILEIKEKPSKVGQRRRKTKVIKPVSSEDECNDPVGLPHDTSDEEYDAKLTVKKSKRLSGKRKRKQESTSEITMGKYKT